MATTLVFSTVPEFAPELTAAAKSIGDTAVVAALGDQTKDAETLGAGADKVLTVAGDAFETGDSGVFAAALAALVEQTGAERVFVTGNRRGKEIAPRLAARLDAAYVSSAVGVDAADGLQFTRKYMGGRTLATEAVTADTVVATFAPHTFDPATGAPGATESATVDLPSAAVTLVERKERETGGVNIEEADVIVAFGRGVKSEDDMKMLFELAEAIGGEVGCTRPISADLHWLGDERWIGLSGKVVKPKAYLAFGVSGQIQHLAGCRDAGTIVVVNTDSNAPFFEHCDYGIVGDLYKIVPELIKKLQ